MAKEKLLSDLETDIENALAKGPHMLRVEARRYYKEYTIYVNGKPHSVINLARPISPEDVLELVKSRTPSDYNHSSIGAGKGDVKYFTITRKLDLLR